jgi:hypothetical protein
MAKKATIKLRPWTKEDLRTLKTLAREKTKTSVIARKLKRSLGATYRKRGRSVWRCQEVGSGGPDWELRRFQYWSS